MKSTLKLSTFQIGSPIKAGQGLRIGATRRPPRGVRKERWTIDGYFDVWLPTLAPSATLFATVKTLNLEDPKVRAKFFETYERELLSTAEGRQTVDLIAKMAARTAISVGCFCADESRCHRSRLYEIILRQAEDE
jgi:uncharacterized protein YeaO (DUF488 family)